MMANCQTYQNASEFLLFSLLVGICVQYDTIVKVITEHPEDTTKLVKLMKYVEELDTKDLLVIKVTPTPLPRQP